MTILREDVAQAHFIIMCHMPLFTGDSTMGMGSEEGRASHA